MKQLMAAELSGELLRVALYELIPMIEGNKRYVVRVDQVARGEKVTLQGNDLSMHLDEISEIDLQALNHSHIEGGDELQRETIALQFEADDGALYPASMRLDHGADHSCNAPITADRSGIPYCHKGYQCGHSALLVANTRKAAVDLLDDDSGVCRNFAPIEQLAAV